MNPLDGTLAALKMIPRAQLHLYRDVLGCNPSQPQPGLPMPTPSGIVHLTIEVDTSDDVGLWGLVFGVGSWLVMANTAPPGAHANSIGR